MPLNLGDVRIALREPKVFGVIEAGHRLEDDRDILVQIEVGPDEYEYRAVRAVGITFIDGEFKAVIAAGDKV